MISMFSISSGLMSSRRDGPDPPTPFDELFVAELIRIPSTMTTGSLLRDSDAVPRMRMREPVPVAPVVTTCTPAERPESTWPMELTGSSAILSATAIWDVAFASSTFRVWPVTVVTTAASEKAAWVSVTFAVADPLATTVTGTRLAS